MWGKLFRATCFRCAARAGCSKWFVTYGNLCPVWSDSERRRNRGVPLARSHQQRDRHSHADQLQHGKSLPPIGHGQNEGFDTFRNCREICRLVGRRFPSSRPAKQESTLAENFPGCDRQRRVKRIPHSVGSEPSLAELTTTAALCETRRR